MTLRSLEGKLEAVQGGGGEEFLCAPPYRIKGPSLFHLRKKEREE